MIDDFRIPESPPIEESISISIPFSREAEEGILGAILINPDCMMELSGILKPSDFYVRKHTWIYQAFQSLMEENIPIDYRTTCDELQRVEQLNEIGGPACLTTLISSCSNSLNATAYARTVHEQSRRRNLIAAANQVATLAYNHRRSIEEVMNGSMEVIQSQVEEIDNDRFILRDETFAFSDLAPTEYLVDGMLTSGSVNVFYGEPGSKKTYAALSMAVCVANGRKWLGFPTKRNPVLFIDEESGEKRFSRRLHACIKGELCLGEKFSLSFVNLAGFKLDEQGDPTILKSLVRRTGAKLVIIDALADVMSGDENNKSDVQPVFNSLRKIAEDTGAAILLIHHAGKTGGYRGSSAIKGAVDLMVQISSENDSNFINFRSEKNRDGKANSWTALASWGPEQFEIKRFERMEKQKINPSYAYVIGYLTKHGESSVDDIKDAADICSPDAARLAIYRLAQEKKIIRTNPDVKGQGIHAKYSLP